MGSAKQTLIRRWALEPWHCWIKESPQWLEILSELWARMPETAYARLEARVTTLIILPPVSFGRITRIAKPMPAGAFVLQLDQRLLERPHAETLAILAHELAHLCTPITDDDLVNDLAADELVRQWGFEAELKMALERDLDKNHPRLCQPLP